MLGIWLIIDGSYNANVFVFDIDEQSRESNELIF